MNKNVFISIFFLFSNYHYLFANDIILLSQLTNLPENTVIHWMKVFQAIEDWYERPKTTLNNANGYLHRAYNIKMLSELTGLTEKTIIYYMKDFQGIEEWNERGAYYYTVLPELINKYNLKKGCEVGVATGGHSYAILKNSNAEKLYSVDPFSPELYSSFAKQGVLELYFLRIKFRMHEFGERSEMIRLYSLPAADTFNDNDLDFVFIDADHSYEAVKKDIAAWYKKIRSGGIISGDDYATIWPGVPQAVNEFFNSLGLAINIDKHSPRVWWVRKP